MERENTLPTEYVNGLNKEQAEQAILAAKHDFYKVLWEKNGDYRSLKLLKDKIADRLRSMGFFRYDNGTKSKPQYVHIVDNRIELIAEYEIIDAFEDYCTQLPPRIVHNVIMPNKMVQVDSALIREALYEHLDYFSTIFERLRPERAIRLLKDTKKTKYLFFNNTAIAITADGVQPIAYENLKHNIWLSSILERNFTYTNVKGDYEKFIEDITGSDDERKRSLMSILGYLMHNYFENDLRAAFFTDVNNDQIGEAAGRTGKGLIGKGIANVMNRDRNSKIYVSIPAKDMNAKDERRYALADESTSIIHIEDANKRFNIEQIYCDITDGAKIKHMYKDSTVKLIKIMISINHTLELESESDKGRLIIFEVNNYYNSKFRPIDKYGRWFFGSEWTEQDWNEFYSFMCRCAQTYFKNGIIEAAEVNYSNRTLFEHVPEDFVYWFEDFLSIDLIDKQEHSYSKEAIYNTFTNKYKDYLGTRQNTVTKWCTKFCSAKQIPYCVVRSTIDKLVIYPTKETFAKSK